MFLFGPRRGYSLQTEHCRMLRSRTGWVPVPRSEEEASASLTGMFEEESLDRDLVLTIFFKQITSGQCLNNVFDSERFQ
jgi:hypothetical protein